MKPLNSKGQSLIEALSVGMMTLLAFSITFMILYRALVYFTARHCVNELIFCLSSLQPEAECKNKFTKQKDAFLIFKETSDLKVHKSQKQIIVAFEVSATGTPDLRIERRLRLPLEENIKKRRTL